MAKKKKGCLRRLIGWAIRLTVLCVGIFFLADIFLDDTDYISEEEIASGEEDISFEELMDFFFDYYGYYPDEDSDDDYYLSDYYNDDDYNDYYDDFYDDNNNYVSDYASDYENDYDNNYVAKNDTSSNSPEPVKNTQKSEATPKASNKTWTSDAPSKFVECAKSYLGTPYVWGGNSHSGIDCSGLVYNAAKEAGIGTLPRTAKALQSIASRIDKSELSAGDLVFFSSGGSISHVAIYMDNNQIIHSVSDGSKTGVITSKLSQDYWKKHYYSSGRIINTAQ